MPAHSPEELDQLFSEALNAGDLDALVALYEPQAVFVSEPGQTVSGTEAIRAVLSAFVSMKPKITLEVQTLGQGDFWFRNLGMGRSFWSEKSNHCWT